MGCRRWVEIALLVVALGASLQVSAATRKQVTLPSPKSVVDNPGGSPTKSGDTLSISGQPMDGEYIPGINPGKNIKISPTPRIDFSIPKTITLGKNLLKGGGLAGLFLGPMLQGMLDAVGGLIDESGNAVKQVDSIVPPLSPSDYWWQVQGNSVHYSDPSAACSGWGGSLYGSGTNTTAARVSDSHWTCNSRPSTGSGGVTLDIWRFGSSCSSGSTYSSSFGACVSPSFVSLTDSDFSTMADFASGQNAAWLAGLLKSSCSGALDPAGCVADLKTASSLSGPSSVAGPTTTSTTTSTKPDGTTSTETTTTTTRFDITYGDTYFDYSKTSVATTSTDGQQTSQTTTSEDSVPAEEQQQDQQEEDQDTTFSDTAFPEVEPFYEQKYPDGLSGVWQSRSAQVDSSPFVSFLRSFVPSFSGSCPTFGLPLDVGIADFGYRNFDSLCGVFEFVGVIILATAVFTARQLMMGG